MKKSFSTKLSIIRKEQGHTQDFLADYLNVSRSSIGNYERGLNEPSIDILVKIADLYNVSLDWLLGRTDVKYSCYTEHKTKIELTMKIYKLLNDYEIDKKHK